MGLSSFVVIEKIYSCLFTANCTRNHAITNMLKVLYKLSKVTDVFTQFLIFSRKLIKYIQISKGEEGKAYFKATIITY